MVEISKYTIESIISYLDLIKSNANDEDTILSINQIKKELTKNMIVNKVQIIDKFNHLIHLTKSLSEQVYLLDDRMNCMNINVSDYVYSIGINLDYLHKQLDGLSEAIENILYENKNKDV